MAEKDPANQSLPASPTQDRPSETVEQTTVSDIEPSRGGPGLIEQPHMVPEAVPEHLMLGNNDEIIVGGEFDDPNLQLPFDPDLCGRPEITDGSVITGSIDYLRPGTPREDPKPAPWGQPVATAAVNIPSHFPNQVKNLINRLPVMEGSIGCDIRQVVVNVLDYHWPAGNAMYRKRLQQIAALLQLAPYTVLDDVAHILACIVGRCWQSPAKQIFWLSDIIEAEMQIRQNSFIRWLRQMDDTTLAEVLSMPTVQKQHLLHLFQHLAIFVKPGLSNPVPNNDMKFVIGITPCPEKLYTPPRPFAAISRFIASLPVVPKETIAHDDRCGICHTKYGEEGSFVDNLPENAVTLPCSHSFGQQCLQILFGPKDRNGWEHTQCPLCRAGLAMPYV